MEPYKRIEKELNGVTYRLSIYPDETPESPREWDNAGTMVCWHRHYNLGDEQPKETASEFLKALSCIEYDGDDEKIERSMVEKAIAKNFIMLPLYLYDHSGITISTGPFSCPWDSGQVGFIYISKERAIKEWGKKVCSQAVRRKAIKCLQQEVETYDQYLRGDIYGFSIERKEVCDKGHEHWVDENSCWGFYGSEFKTNGMTDHFGKEFSELFAEAL